MLAKRADKICRKSITLVNVAADFASVINLCGLFDFGLRFDIFLIVIIGHARNFGKHFAVGNVCKEKCV